MKIGYFYTTFPSKKNIEEGKVSFSGGGAVVTYKLAMEMGKRGNEVRIFSASHNLHGREEEHPYKVKAHYYGSVFNIYNAFFPPFGFLKPLKHNLDIIHTGVPSPPMDFASIVYKKVKKVPLVITYHSEPCAYGYGSITRRIGLKFYKKLVNILLSEAHLIISPSKRFIEDSRLKDYRDKVIVIPNGIEIKDFEVECSKEEARKQVNLPLDRKILLFLNALLPQKGPDVLIESMAKIVKRVPEVYLVFVGKGEMRLQLEDMAIEKGVHRHAKFAGFVDEELKPLYYKASDIFVLPSTRRHESFGIVNLEAMASGVPIVASRIGGVPGVVKDGENGLLVPPKDPDALAETIIHLLENEDLRRKMGEKGKEMVKNYTWEEVAKRTEEVYKGLLKSHQNFSFIRRLNAANGDLLSLLYIHSLKFIHKTEIPLSPNNLVGASLGGFKGLNIAEAINLYSKLSDEFGLNAVEIRFEKEKGRPSLWPWEAGNKLKAFLKRFKVAGAHLPFVYLNPVSPNPSVRKNSIEQLKEAIRKAAELEMNYAVMHARGLAMSLSKEEEFEEWIKVFEELTDCAKENSILLTIENADFLWNLSDIVKAIKKVNSKWLKMTFDVGHAHMRKVPPLQKYPLKELSLRALDMVFPFFLKKNMPYEKYGSIKNFMKSEGELISTMHLHDYNGRKDHIEIGEGKIDFSFLSLLKSNFKGTYIFEIELENYHKDFQKSYKKFTELMKK